MDLHTNLSWDALVQLDRAEPGPLHAKVTTSLREAIRSGRIPAGSALPPSRLLADELDCSRWVVTEAYAQLVAEGYLEARVGSATRVAIAAADTEHAVAPRTNRRASPPPLDLAPGLPDLRWFPRSRWLRAQRAVASETPASELGYGPVRGHYALRAVLAGYLGRVRGAVVEAGNVTICASVTEGVTSLCRLLSSLGFSAVAVEEPGWRRLAAAAELAGIETVPVRADGDGLVVQDMYEHPRVRLVIVSPAHQFPMGSVLSPFRRAALIDWARRTGGLILEDDYDAEFRYDRRPVGTVQGRDPSVVVLFGSLSKTLAPSVGIGWMVTPPHLTEAVRRSGIRLAAPPVLDQLTLAAFIDSGDYDRHLRSSRKRYRLRRDALIQALSERLPAARVSGVAAGLHLLIDLPGGTDVAMVTAAAGSLGVRVSNLDAFRAEPDPANPGLVLGYGNLADGEIDQAVERLAEAILRSDRSARPARSGTSARRPLRPSGSTPSPGASGRRSAGPGRGDP
jgi:GntR family transcriptional regulator/MocR family aminotransferase